MTEVAAAVVEGFDLAYELSRMNQDAGECFAVWLSMPDRSLQGAADLTGHSGDAVRQWSSRFKWKDAAARYDSAQASVLMGALRSAIVRHSFEAVKIGVGIMADTTAKDGDRLKAAMWIASLGGLGPRSAPAIEAGENGAGLISADDLRKMATSGNPEDLRRLVDLTTGREDR